MERDKDLTQWFADYRPDLTEKAVFLEKLERRLDAVEYVKQMQARQIRRYKVVAVVALVVGIAGGFAAATFVPVFPHLPRGTESFLLLFLQRYAQEFLFVAVATALSAGIILLLSTWQQVLAEYADSAELLNRVKKSRSTRGAEASN